MNFLITGCCGHIGSYLADNVYKIKKLKKQFLLIILEQIMIQKIMRRIFRDF